MRTPWHWYMLLVGVTVASPYLFGVAPHRRRDWIALTAAFAFLTWLLAGFRSVRSR